MLEEVLYMLYVFFIAGAICGISNLIEWIVNND